MSSSEELDTIANLYQKTKDKKYKDLWYKKLEEVAHGLDRTKRRNLSTGRSNETDDGTYKVIK
jgi:hypothetical protein